MNERNRAVDLLEKVREAGINDTTILEELIYKYMSAKEAVEFLTTFADERDISL